jgi:hypothetical protein
MLTLDVDSLMRGLVGASSTVLEKVRLIRWGLECVVLCRCKQLGYD